VHAQEQRGDGGQQGRQAIGFAPHSTVNDRTRPARIPAESSVFSDLDRVSGQT
jgi:hypothetical protein